MRSGGLRCGWLSTRSVARLAESGRLLRLRGVVCSSPDSGLHVGGRLVAYRRVNEQRQESVFRLLDVPSLHLEWVGRCRCVGV